MSKQKEKTFKLGKDSIYKIWLLFKDGHTENYYSLDWKNSSSKVKDMNIGLDRFEKNFIKPNANQLPIARIYTISDNKMIKEYRYGVLI